MNPGGADLDWLTPQLAFGGQPACLAEDLAQVHGIRALLDLRAEACGDAAALARCDIAFLHLPTPDHCGISPYRLDAAVAFARAMIAEGSRVLVHCQHGIGRAPLASLCILVDQGCEPLEALRRAKAARPKVSPSPAQYEAWAAWLRRRGGQPPTFDAFAATAYKHLVHG